MTPYVFCIFFKAMSPVDDLINSLNDESLETNVVISRKKNSDFMNISVILLKIQTKLKTNEKSENLQCEVAE